MQKLVAGLLIFITLTLGCAQTTAVSPTPPSATITAVSANTTAPTASPAGSGFVAEFIDPQQPPYAWPAPQAPLPDLARTIITPSQIKSEQTFNQPTAPERQDARLAQAYNQLQQTPTSKTSAAAPIPLGSETIINISQNKTNHIVPIEAVLLGKSDHAYFWFDTGQGSVQPAETAVATMGSLFDEIYAEMELIFGQPALAAADDPRVHIVTASPLALCDVTLSTSDSCGLAGYFNSSDSLPATINPNSNERNMFVMNADWFGTDFFLNVLIHEFRHLIEDHYDPGEEGWEIEGSATLAEVLLGFPDQCHTTRQPLFAKSQPPTQ